MIDNRLRRKAASEFPPQAAVNQLLLFPESKSCFTAFHRLGNAVFHIKSEQQMPNFDPNSLSISELKTFQKSIAKTIAEYNGRKKTEARAVLEAHAKRLGFTLSELI